MATITTRNTGSFIAKGSVDPAPVQGVTCELKYKNEAPGYTEKGSDNNYVGVTKREYTKTAPKAKGDIFQPSVTSKA